MAYNAPVHILQYALLGIIQGLTEFLPVSSKSHLLLAEKLLHFSRSGAEFEVALHVGTLLSVVLVYRAELARIVRERNWNFIGLIALTAAVSATPMPYSIMSCASCSPSISTIRFSMRVT